VTTNLTLSTADIAILAVLMILLIAAIIIIIGFFRNKKK